MGELKKFLQWKKGLLLHRPQLFRLDCLLLNQREKQDELCKFEHKGAFFLMKRKLDRVSEKKTVRLTLQNYYKLT